MSWVALTPSVGALLSHAQALLALGVVLAGPAPLAVALAVASSGLHGVPLSHHMVSAGTSWLAAQTLLALLLGLAGRLTLAHVVVGELVLAAAGLWALARCLGTTPRPDAAAPRARIPIGAGTAIITLLSAIAGWLLCSTLATPIREYDSLAYHLPAVAHWYRTAGLEMLGQGLVDHYPYNFELVALLLALPFHGHFAIGLAQVLAWSLFGAAVHAVATLLGARALPALVAALLAMLQPLVLGLVTDTLQVDLAFAAAFLMTLYLALSWATGARDWSLALLAGAWLVGVKASGPVYLGLVVLVAVVVRTCLPRPASSTTGFGPRRLPTAVVLSSVAAALVIGGFWYARNVLATGNPLGLIGVTVAGVPILEGPIASSELRRSSLAAVFRVLDPGDWIILLKQVAVRLGPPFALLLVGAGMLVTVRRDTGPFWRDRVVLLVTALVTLCVTLYALAPFGGDDVGTHGWRVSPWTGQGLRYALPATGTLAVAAALGMTRVGRLDGALAALAAGVAWLSLPRGRAPVLLGFGLLWLGISLRPRLPRWARLATAIGTIAVVVVGSLLLRDLKERAYASTFPVVAYVDRHVARGERIGLLVTNRASVYFGSRLTADVAFVPHGDPDVEHWVRRLREGAIRFVGVGPVLEDWWLSSNELAWLDGDHRHFERVHGTDYRRSSVLYRVRDADDAAGRAAPPVGLPGTGR